MHISEVVIDGFKSYANRTVISGFDPLFNAITGLNGTGKSNILDSICFVLGITNLRSAFGFGGYAYRCVQPSPRAQPAGACLQAGTGLNSVALLCGLLLTIAPASGSRDQGQRVDCV